MRNYLETFLFYSARTKNFFACENILLKPEKERAQWLKLWCESSSARADPYPREAKVPLEIEAHRRLAAQILDRPVVPDEFGQSFALRCKHQRIAGSALRSPARQRFILSRFGRTLFAR
jgi:hypothetical protein